MECSQGLARVLIPAVAGASKAVIVEGLEKRYAGRMVVDDISFSIDRGECFGLLGPNGAGKTTVLRMLLAHTPPSAGRIEVLGYSMPGEARAARARIGVVAQEDNLDPDFTVLENLLSYARYFGIKPRAMRRGTSALLEFAALEGREGARIHELSGGMQRRLTLARALVNDPRLLVLDEPTTGLDPQARQLIWQRLRSLLASGRTLFLTTHYMEEAERLCDRVAIIDGGRLVAIGSPHALIGEHVEAHVFEFTAPDLVSRAADLARLEGVHIERVGETTLVYARSPEPVRAWLSGCAGEQYWYRPGNLEDVFFRLTGRDLRDR